MDETASTMGFLQRFIGIYFYPGKVFQALREKPTILAPLIVIALMAAATVPFVALDPDIMEQQILAQNPQASQEEIAQAQQMMSSPVMAVVTTVIGALAVPVIMLLYALMFYLIFNVAMGGGATYKSILSFAAHANLISVLGILIIIPLTLYQGQAGVTLNLGLLVPFLEDDSFIYRFLKGIDIFIGWWICLLSIGFGILYQMPTARAATVLFALWGIWILLKTILSPYLGQFIPGM